MLHEARLRDLSFAALMCACGASCGLSRLYNVFKFSVLLRQAKPPIGVNLYTWAESFLCSQLRGTAPGFLRRHSAYHFSCSLNVFLWVLSSALKHHMWVYPFAEKGSILLMSAQWSINNGFFFPKSLLQQAHTFRYPGKEKMLI